MRFKDMFHEVSLFCMYCMYTSFGMPYSVILDTQIHVEESEGFLIQI